MVEDTAEKEIEEVVEVEITVEVAIETPLAAPRKLDHPGYRIPPPDPTGVLTTALPNIENSEKLVVVQVTVLAEALTEQPLSASQALL
jgi:hypothetical protein